MCVCGGGSPFNFGGKNERGKLEKNNLKYRIPPLFTNLQIPFTHMVKIIIIKIGKLKICTSNPTDISSSTTGFIV